jgi:L-threonylcarbamoyladenylate synthase
LRRISIEALTSSPEEIRQLRDLLARGGVAAVPTETFYGFAADPLSETGIQRVVKAKRRDRVKALLVLFADWGQLTALGVTASRESLEPYFRVWPAPLTVVLPIRKPLPASLGSATLGVRIPAEPRLRRLLESTGPITATSVNRTGEPPISDPDTVEASFRSDVDLLVDGGRTPGGEPSTVIDGTQERPRVLRAGAFPWPPES